MAHCPTTTANVAAPAIPDITITEPASAAPQVSPSTAFDLKSVTNSITYAATAALQLYATYRKVTLPIVNPGARTVLGNGSVIAATSDGLIQTRNSSGQIVKQKPAVGQPQSTIDGQIVINNGDGTYTLIAPDGSQRVIKYPGGISTIGGFSLSDIGPTQIAIGIGLLGLLLKVFKK